MLSGNGDVRPPAKNKPNNERSKSSLGHHPRVSGRDEVAIEVIVFGSGAKDSLLVVGIIGRGGEGRWNVRSRKGATGLDAIAGEVIGIGQRPKHRGALLVRDGLQFRSDIVPVLHLVRIRIGHTRSKFQGLTLIPNSIRSL